MAKAPAVQALLDHLATEMGFNPANKSEGKCIQCGEVAAPRCITDAGKREFEISGFCEVCFDAMFEEKED